MRIKVSDRQAGGSGSNVCNYARAFYDRCQAQQILVIPGGRNALEYCRSLFRFRRVPANAEAVAVQRFLSLAAVIALVDDRMFRFR